MICNYFEKKEKKQTSTFITPKSNIRHVSIESQITELDRSYAIQKLYDLHLRKEYQPETLFTAQQILDRYLFCIGHKSFPRERICRLATIAMLMAAKLEQPISPSFLRMINLLSDDEKRDVNKANLIALETDILFKLGFDFNFPGPIQYLERFLRVLDYDMNKNVQEMCFQICKFCLNDAKFLDFRPSQVAACSCILSINIYERDKLVSG
jgi:hypothetical protein